MSAKPVAIPDRHEEDMTTALFGAPVQFNTEAIDSSDDEKETPPKQTKRKLQPAWVDSDDETQTVDVSATNRLPIFGKTHSH